jgi:pimeloyl-ACP methyl ester carboxylesterase
VDGVSRIVALHGVPTSPALWGRVPLAVVAPAIRGLATAEPRAEWSLDGLVDEVLPLLTPETVLLGHDLGGVIAAMAAVRTPVRAVVLSGTALGLYWAAVRLTARTPLDRYFYTRFGGRRFLAGSVAPSHSAAVLGAFPPVPDLPARMRAIARAMRPPPGLARALGAATQVHLVWGRHDRWYPPLVARAIARATGGTLAFVEAGHLCMWEAPEGYAAAVRAVVQARG